MMQDQEIIDLILHGSEERNLEYKSSMNWGDVATRAKVTKAAMGMANIRDGGVLIFGVEEPVAGIFEPNGMSEVDASSFNQDDVMSSVNKYADPFVELIVKKVVYGGKPFVVIQIMEFKELPVVCKKSGIELKRGSMYTRSMRKNESTTVSSQSEMREILEMAFDKRMRRYREQFYRWGMVQVVSAGEIEGDRFRKQLEASNILRRIERISNGAHWKIVFRPSAFQKYRVGKLSLLREIVWDNAVRLRGTPFPYCGAEETVNGDDWVESRRESTELQEYWRVYQSGQLVLYRSLSARQIAEDFGRSVPPGDFFLTTRELLFTITEAYEFAMRLAGKDFFGSEVNISIALSRIEGMRLVDLRQSELQHLAAVDEIRAEKRIGSELLVAEGHEEALRATLHFFERFNWSHPPRQLISEMQRKLLERRF